jgi:hypothetical protein
MRRFEVTGPSVLIGGKQFDRLEHTILVKEGQIAVLADDDSRCEDLARSPFLREIVDESSDDSTETPSAAKRGKKATESEGV